MDLMKKYMQQEDEMDFMPIIPLHEGDGDGVDETVIPSELPLLPLRNTVLFPGVVIPITVGREVEEQGRGELGGSQGRGTGRRVE